MKRPARVAGALAGVVIACCCAAANAQVTHIRSSLIERAGMSVPGREAVVMRLEVDPGVVVGRHTHPGDEIGYVLEGAAELLVDGEPARKLKPGDAFVVTTGKAHSIKNIGREPLKVVADYVVEKGKPLVTPAAPSP